MWLLNQFSFVFVALLIGALLAFGLWRWQGIDRLVRLALFVLYVAALIVVAATFRYSSNDAGSVEQVEAALSAGRPTLVMLYSNY
jgi:uncharacterized membrane protein YqjE